MKIQTIIEKYAWENRNSLSKVIAYLSDYLERTLSKEAYCEVCKEVFEITAGGHYDRTFAGLQLPKMYYKDTDGVEHRAPYWTEEEAEDIYQAHKDDIPEEYNFYDFEVVLNMIKSDNYSLVEKWFKGEDTEQRYVEMAINWLNDDDNPYGTEKVWRYFNSVRTWEK